MVTRRRYLSSTVCHSHLIQTRGTASAVLGDKRKRSLLACILQQLLPVNHMSPLGSPLQVYLCVCKRTMLLTQVQHPPHGGTWPRSKAQIRVTGRCDGVPRVSRSSPTRQQIRGSVKAAHEDAQELSPQVAIGLQQLRVQGCHSSARIFAQACAHHSNAGQAGEAQCLGVRGGGAGFKTLIGSSCWNFTKQEGKSSCFACACRTNTDLLVKPVLTCLNAQHV